MGYVLTPKQLPAFSRRGAYRTYEGHCAFCGKPISEKGDWRICKLPSGVEHEGKAIFTFMPSCLECAPYLEKGDLEDFRKLVEERLATLKNDTLLQIANRTGGFSVAETPFKFFFERLQASNQAFFRNLL